MVHSPVREMQRLILATAGRDFNCFVSAVRVRVFLLHF
jgi:hypothetical protein